MLAIDGQTAGPNWLIFFRELMWGRNKLDFLFKIQTFGLKFGFFISGP